MEKKMKRFLSGCLAALLILAALPGRVVSGSEQDFLLEDENVNAENLVDPEEIENQEEKLQENILENPQENKNIESVNNNNEILEELLGDETGETQNAFLGDDENTSPPMVRLGESYSTAIKTDGSLWTWGCNWTGQLGSGVGRDKNKPIKILEDVKSVCLGAYDYRYDYGAAIKTDGSLWMWGKNHYGQFGDDSTETRFEPVKVLQDVKSVSLPNGYYNGSSAAIKTDGSLWTWGHNDYGQLGDGSTIDRHKPIKVLENVKNVCWNNCGGWETNCAAIKTDDSLWMWGNNFYGQLGDGSTEHRYEPVKVLEDVKSVCLTSDCSAAVKTDGSLWMWGANHYGQLGDGSTEHRYEPVKVLEDVKSVCLTHDCSAAVKTDGSLWMWGYSRLIPGISKHTPVKVLTDVKSISLNYHGSAAIKTDGSLWMWGHNVGDGSTTEHLTPVKVLENVKSVSLGSGHRAAIKTDGSLWMWGANGSGQLGDGSTTNHPAPVKIMDLGTPTEEPPSDPVKNDESPATYSNNNIHITAYDTDASLLGEALENVAITVDGFGTAVTDKSGKAVIPNTLEDAAAVNAKVTASRDGYRDYIFNRDIYNKNAELLFDSNRWNISMHKLKDRDANTPYVSTLMYQTSAGLSGDAMYNKYDVSVDNSATTQPLQVNAVWHDKTPSSYILYQKNGPSYTSADGSFNLNLYTAFDSGPDIYVKLIASDGTESEEKTMIHVLKTAHQTGEGTSTLTLIDAESPQAMGGDVALLSGESVSLKLGGIDIKSSVEAGKVKIMLGKSASKGEIFSNKEWEDWKKLCEVQPKDLNMSQWKNVLESIKTPYTSRISADTKVYGYLEGVLNENGDTILSGSLKIGTNLSAGIQTQYMAGPVPVYAKITAGAEGAADGSFGYNWTKKNIMADKTSLEFKIEPYLKAEGGVGVMAVATAGVEGKGSLPISAKIGIPESVNLKLKANLAIKLQLLAFSYDLNIAEKTWQLYPPQDEQRAETDTLQSADIMDDFQVSDRSYLENDSEWLGDTQEEQAMTTSAGTATTERILQTNIYPDAEMQIVETDTAKMLLWTADDESRTAINRSKLVYSLYDANRDAWSAPEAIYDDGTADYAPAVTTDGSHIYVAWQNSADIFSEEAPLSEVAEKSSISMSIWEPANGFSTPLTVSDKQIAAFSPKIALDGNGTPYVAYLHNTENNLLLTSGINQIRYAVVRGSSIEENVLVADAGLVTSLDTHFTDQYEVSYTVDMDKDLATLEDREIYKSSEASQQKTENEGSDSNAQYVDWNGGTYRFWYADDSICMEDSSGMATCIYTDETGSLTDDFTVVTGNPQQIAVIWTSVDKNDCKQIEGILYDATAGTWSKSIQISETDGSIYHPKGIFLDDGSIQFLYKKTINGQTDLCLLTAVPSVDLSVKNAYCEESAFVPDQAADVSVEIANHATQPVNNYTIDINGTQTALSETIQPGESKIVMAQCQAPGFLSYGEIAVTIQAPNDTNAENNTFLMSTGYTDLTMNLVEQKQANGSIVEISVANQSYVDTNAVLEIRANSIDGDVLKSIELGSLQNGNATQVTYTWGQEKEEYKEDVADLYFVVVADKQERYTNDNYDFISVGAAKHGSDTPTAEPTPPSVVTPQAKKTQSFTVTPSTLTLYKGVKTKTLKVSKAIGTVTYKSSNVKVAKVNAKGKITPISKGVATITVKASGNSKYKAAMRTVKVTVKNPSLKLKKSSAKVKKNKTVKISANATPSGKITYKSENPKVATVNTKGVVKGRKIGTAKIIVKCNGVSKIFKIIVM